MGTGTGHKTSDTKVYTLKDNGVSKEFIIHLRIF